VTLEETILESCARLGLPPEHPCDQTLRPTPETGPPAHLPRLTLTPSEVAGADADLVLLGKLAEGGQGLIRVAEQRSLGRKVAIKCLHPGEKAPAEADTLLREGYVTGHLEHPNIVPVHQVGWTDSQGPVIVMKRIDGVAWKQLIRDPQSPGWDGYEGDRLERHLRILVDVCHALSYAHDHDIVHRDIKPANIMIGGYGEVYLLDWGVAFALADGPEGGELVGTPSYMAPEMVVEGGVHLDKRTDVYQLGAVLHDIITGTPRHTGDTVYMVLTAAARSEPFDFGPDVSPQLAAICNKACSRRPDDRYSEVAELRVAIEEFLRHRSSEAAAQRATISLTELQELAVSTDAYAQPVMLKVHRRYSACRFGFEQALQEWPENPTAREGLRAVLRSMFEYELAARNVGACDLLLADMPDAEPELLQRLETMRAEIAEQATAGEELREIRRQQRFHGADWGRTLFAIGDGVVSMFVLALLGQIVRARNMHISPLENAAWVGLLLAAKAAPLYLFRKSLFDTRIFRQMIVLLIMGSAILMLNRAIAGIRGMSFVETIMADCVVMTALGATAAVTLSPVLWFTALIGALMTLAAAIHVEYAAEILGMAYLIHCLYLAVLIRPRGPKKLSQ